MAEVTTTENNEIKTPTPTQVEGAKQRPLKEILSTGRDRKLAPTAQGGKEAKPADTSESVHTIMRLLAETKKVTNAAIRERLSALQSPTSTNKEFNRALQTVAALTLPEEGVPAPENWEQSARTEILYSLREQIVERVMLRNKRVFESSGMEEGIRMIKALAIFRKASKSLEIRYCSRENMVPGSNNIDSNVLMDSPKKAKIAALEETLYCLAQLSLGTTRESLPKMLEEESANLQQSSLILQNPRGQKPTLEERMKSRIEEALSGSNAKTRVLAIVKDIFSSLNPDEKSKKTLEHELSIFDEVEATIGTNIEEIDSLSKEEFGNVQELEEIYNKLEKVRKPEKFAPPSNKQELELYVFQGIRDIAPSLGKTTTVILTSQLANDSEWVERFKENGTDAIYNAKAYKKIITLTEPENTLFGDPTDPDKYMEEGKTIRDALSMVYKAEASMYNTAIYESLSQEDREDIQSLAQRVLTGDIAPEEVESNPTIKALETIQSNAEKMASAVGKEVEGSEKSLETLPRALKEKERQERVSEALNNAIRELSSPEIMAGIETLISEEEGKISELLSTEENEETKPSAIVNSKEKIATLEALRDFSKGFEELENQDYDNLLGTIGLTRVPRTLREHALVSLCDNKAANGTKLKTKDILVRLEATTGQNGLTNKIRGGLGRLRHWKERDTAPMEIKRKDLALSICRAPENLKRNIPRELTAALKSCITCPPWKDPFSIGPKELGLCNGAYLVAKKSYGPEEGVMKKIRALHTRTAELQKEAGKSIRTRAEKIAEDLRSKAPNSLKSLENDLLREILRCPSPKDALEYLESWYNSIGHEPTLQAQTNQDKKDKEVYESLPMVGRKIQTKIENLLEISKFLKEVSRNPEALAETFIQHRLHEQKNIDKEAWEDRMDRAKRKIEVEITREKKELEDWKSKFNNIFDDSNEEELSPDEIERTKSMKAVCFRKILQKERAVEMLFLKRDRIRNLERTTKSLKHMEKPEDVTEALREKIEEPFSFSMGSALDAALTLAGNPTKIELPKKKMGIATPLQMLEAGAVERSVKAIRETLKDAAVILKERVPELSELDIDNQRPESIAHELKKATFSVLKEVEMHLWESGKSVKLSKEEEEEFLTNNPEMLSARKDWIDKLQKTKEDLKETALWAVTQPQKEEKKKRSLEKDEKETKQELEELEEVMA
jgi:hypothetical protein